MSEDTVKLIDQEIREFIDRNYVRAKQLIEENMDILHAMKDCLMQYETIDAKQIDDLMARREVRPPEHWEPKDKKPEAPGSGGAASTATSSADVTPTESHSS
jgi:cell division protease FtsH